jgi:hypothetical protein
MAGGIKMPWETAPTAKAAPVPAAKPAAKAGVKTDQAGGVVPQDIAKAKEADLITLPADVTGTNCGNCKYVTLGQDGTGMCKHPEVKQAVNNRNCCAYWDNAAVKRPWKQTKEAKPS